MAKNTAGKAGASALAEPSSNGHLEDVTFGAFPIRVTLTGTTPLLMHNPRMMDPLYEVNRELKAITSKRGKTDTDLARIEALEWFGGLYEEDGVIVQPVAKFRKALIEAARRHKLGTAVERAVQFEGINAPLIYDGPREPSKLYETPGFISRLPVVVRSQRVMRVRPQFFPWGLEITGTLMGDAGLNFEELERLADLAGWMVGIGDNRKNNYGRFTAKVSAR